MRKRRVETLAVLALALGGACGGGGDPVPPTTTVAPEPTTTLVQGDPRGIACLNNSTAALALLNDFRLESRGIVAPDPEPYRQKANELRAEHARLGCPGELLRGFPGG